MQDPITLKSGALLQITVAPRKDSSALLRAITRELAKLSIKLDEKLDVASFAGPAISGLLQLLQSEDVEKAAFVCMGKCLYNGQRITEATFEPEEARPDFLPVVQEVIKANVVPFFANLDWLSWITAAQSSNSQKPAATST